MDMATLSPTQPKGRLGENAKTKGNPYFYWFNAFKIMIFDILMICEKKKQKNSV